MKIALGLSVAANVVCLAVVGYMDATAVMPDYTPPIVVYTTNGPTAVGVMQAMALR